MLVVDAQDKLEEIFANHNCKLVKRSTSGLTFEPNGRPGKRFLVPIDIVTEFAFIGDSLKDFQLDPVSECVRSHNFFEFPLHVFGDGVSASTDREYRFVSQDSHVSCVFGRATPAYRWTYLAGRRLPDKFEDTALIFEILNFKHEYVTPRNTVRVINSDPALPIELERANQIVKSSSFALGRLKNVAVAIEKKFSVDQTIFGIGANLPAPEDQTISIPSVSYRTSLSSYYAKGLQIRDPFIQFVSFYQVLEALFVEVSEQTLRDRVRAISNRPAFSSQGIEVDRLIKTVSDFRRTSHETEMLRLVLHTYIDIDELRTAIQDIETRLDEKIYSKRRRWLDSDLEVVTVTSESLVDFIARRVKLIRNSLIHSSDHRERLTRYVPGGKDDRELAKEVPLVRFLAEQVIVASAA